MFWLATIFIGGILFLLLIVSANKSKMPVEWKRYVPYQKEKVQQFVVGIGQESKRIKVFEDLKTEFECGRKVDVLLKMDFLNKHDPFALMVTDKRGRHLGFLKRDQYRMLRTLYDQPKALVRVVNVAISVDTLDGYINRVVELEMYLGYSDRDLKMLEESFNPQSH